MGGKPYSFGIKIQPFRISVSCLQIWMTRAQLGLPASMQDSQFCWANSVQGLRIERQVIRELKIMKLRDNSSSLLSHSVLEETGMSMTHKGEGRVGLKSHYIESPRSWVQLCSDGISVSAKDI